MSQILKPSATAICDDDSANSAPDWLAHNADLNLLVESDDLQAAETQCDLGNERDKQVAITNVKLNEELDGNNPVFIGQVIETVADFETLRNIWSKFNVDPMNSFSWNLSWWKAFQANGKLRLLTFERAGKIVGIAPFYTDRWFGLTRFRFLATGDTCTDYVDLICAPEDYAVCAGSLAEYIREQKFDVVELECPNDDHLVTALTPTLKALYDFDHRDVEPTWLLELSSDWKTFLSARRSSLRRKINKAIRRLESGELTVTSTSKGLSIESGLEILKDLHTRRMNSTGRPGVFADENFEEFLEAAVLEMNAEGKVEIIVASKDDVPIGVQIYFDSSKGFQFYQSGYAPEAMKLEPGHLLFTEMIKQAIARGDTSFDFLRGNEPYKEFWEATPHEQKKLRMVAKKWLPRLVAKAVEASRRMIRGK